MVEKDKRIFALCQKCGKHIYKCEDFLETHNKGVIFRIKCPYCGWLFNHQIFISQEAALPQIDFQQIAEETLKAINKGDDVSRFRVM